MRAMLAVILILSSTAMTALAQDSETGEELYLRYCATCHGLTGEGDGPMAAMLLVPPSNLTSMTERYGEFPLLRVITRIDGRDPLVSHGSDMPVWGWFFEGDGMAVKTDAGQPIMTTAPIVALVEYLRDLQD